MVIPNNDKNFWDLMVAECPKVSTANADSVFVADDVEVQDIFNPEENKEVQATPSYEELLERLSQLEEMVNKATTNVE